jgi:geranylgeranyl diphosphate synthase, type II
MDAEVSFETVLSEAVIAASPVDCPPLLKEALHYAVFPGGARIRPKLVQAVARACGAGAPGAVMAAASAIELLHCASLVHDDLPCFDDASVRRGKVSVHVRFGERIAVLAGDALIAQSFGVVADYPALVRIMAEAASGICAGQAWECEPTMDVARYQRAKTGSLFAACTMMGAAVAERSPHVWRACGMQIGEAFQVADDLRDVGGNAGEIGKPTGQDAAHGLPNMVSQLGYEGATNHFEALLAQVVESVPDCPGRVALGQQIVAVSRAMVPKHLARGAA